MRGESSAVLAGTRLKAVIGFLLFVWAPRAPTFFFGGFLKEECGGKAGKEGLLFVQLLSDCL